MNRRAALQMSIQSIIVFILAFIVMGALIGVITVIIGQVEDGVTQLPPNRFSVLADRDNPVLVENGRLTIKYRQDKDVKFSFYNADWSVSTSGCTTALPQKQICNWNNLTFDIGSCSGFGVNPTATPLIQAAYLPSTVETINPDEVIGFETVMREQGLADGKYTCVLSVNAHHDSGSSTTLTSDQFIMEVN